MLDAREIEIRKNYAFFKDVVGTIIAEHAGEVALLRGGAIVGYYGNPGEAVKAGSERFGNLPFSVQRVVDRPIDLGFLSHAADNGITVQR